jgi:hypothetical protein
MFGDRSTANRTPPLGGVGTGGEVGRRPNPLQDALLGEGAAVRGCVNR